MNYQILLLGVMILTLSIRDNMSQPTNVDISLLAVTTGVNSFGNKFNEAVAKEKSGNYICSPFSVDVVLSMAACGADGQTKTELQQALNLPMNENAMKSGYQTLIDILNNVHGVELAVANKIFIANGFEVKDSFKETTKTYFRSESENLDFSQSEAAAKTINDWAAANTKDRIKDLVKPNDVAGAAMVMTNAVYFKGKWAEKFDPQLTHLMPFHTDEKTTKDVQMMNKQGDYNWGNLNDLNAKYIELPYENENISMFVIVPNEVNGLQHMKENYDKINFTQLYGHKSEVVLHMPKFKVESELDLKSTLAKLNINDMFGDTANFHGITDKAQLKVSKVIQKAFIEVNEEGSEAAAATGFSFFPMSPSVPHRPPQFIVDRPFYCVIVLKTANNSGTVQIFNARISNLN